MAKKIIPFMEAAHIDGKPYIEPFVGGGNMIQAVPFDRRYGSDIDQYVISYLEAIRDGWVPPSLLTKEEYVYIKDNMDEHPPELIGFVGYACSFGTKFFGGYAQGEGRNFAAEGQRNALKQAPLLKGIKFKSCGYQDITYPVGSTVYMDPPYEGTLGYKVGAFDHDEFWGYVKELSATCNVFVSEYEAPDGWIPLIRSESNTSIGLGDHKRRVEQLFVLDASQAYQNQES